MFGDHHTCICMWDLAFFTFVFEHLRLEVVALADILESQMRAAIVALAPATLNSFLTAKSRTRTNRNVGPPG